MTEADMALGPIDFYTVATDDARREFLRRIAARTPLPPHVTVEAAAFEVVLALAERLTRGGAHRLIDALPEGVRSLFTPCLDERSGPVSPMNRAELHRRIADVLGVTPARAEAICAAVLGTVREHVPSEVADDVAAQLPNDLRELFYATPRATEQATLAEDEPDALRATIFAAIERSGSLPDGIDAAGAFLTVMCTFSQRLSAGEARNVMHDLPPSLRALVTACVIHRDERPEVFGRDELVRRVGDHLGTSTVDSERLVRAVFTAVKTCLPRKDVDDVASQLPSDLMALWLEC